MRSISYNSSSHAPRDAGAGGFVLWIAVYTAFMLALIAFNGSTQLFGAHQLSWPASTSMP